jgi:23S rRNA (cytosine1962-C5)-methyltransferase
LSGADVKPLVKLKPHEDRRVRRGHLWVFSNEVEQADPAIQSGDVVHFLTARDEFLGTGFYNPHSLIAGRVIDRHRVELDAAYFAVRLQRAMEMRDRVYGGTSYRWVFGESDDLPGLVMDRYGDALVVESYCAGTDKLLPAVLEAAKLIHPWKSIILRNDVGARKLEKVPLGVETAHGEVDTPHWFDVDGLKLAADLRAGQKTGFFFDQRDNRAAVAQICAGKRVADVFSYSGGFGLWAAKAGAAHVDCVDESAPALALAEEIYKANGFQKVFSGSKANAFEWLGAGKDKYDVVVLDPPKFAPSRKHVPNAIQAYARLNALALKRVTGGGFLATASCSQHIERDTFRQILSRAAYESGRRVRQVFSGGQAKDHPIRLSMPETDYLKFSILHVS